jgi:hypothetical protein
MTASLFIALSDLDWYLDLLAQCQLDLTETALTIHPPPELWGEVVDNLLLLQPARLELSSIEFVGPVRVRLPASFWG